MNGFNHAPGIAWLVAGVLSLAPVTAGAGDATFSANGKIIYTPDSEQKADVNVLDIDAGTLATKHLKLGQGSQEIWSLSLAPDGRVWVLTKSHLWLWDAAKDVIKLSETAPEGMRFDDVACDFATGRVLLTAELLKPSADDWRGRLFLKKNSDTPAVKVFVRRIDRVLCPAFLEDGTLLFGCEGDLWHGQVEDDMDDPRQPRGILNAYRYAPLATRETYVGTPMQTGVRHLAVSKGKVYAHIYRMGGSGWGDLVRLSKPAPLAKAAELDLVPELKKRLQLHQDVLHSVEVLEDNSGRSFLCGSRDGHKIHFTGGASVENGRRLGDRSHYLITDDGEIEPLRAKR